MLYVEHKSTGGGALSSPLLIVASLYYYIIRVDHAIYLSVNHLPILLAWCRSLLLLPPSLHWLVELVDSCVGAGNDFFSRFPAPSSSLLHICCGRLCLD